LFHDYPLLLWMDASSSAGMTCAKSSAGVVPIKHPHLHPASNTMTAAHPAIITRFTLFPFYLRLIPNASPAKIILPE